MAHAWAPEHSIRISSTEELRDFHTRVIVRLQRTGGLIRAQFARRWHVQVDAGHRHARLGGDSLLDWLPWASLSLRTLRFYGEVQDDTGLGIHRNVFTLRDLECLTIEHIPTSLVDTSQPLQFPLGLLPPRLKTLRVSGVDVRTLAPALALPRKLEELTLHFTSPTTKAFADEYLALDSAAVLARAFRRLFSTLTHLDFHHHHLAAFDWGAFQKLETLRVHREHIFPTEQQHRRNHHSERAGATTPPPPTTTPQPPPPPPPPPTPLRKLLPASLVRLTITGCDFSSSSASGPALEASLARLAAEARADKGHALREVELEMVGEGAVPGELFVAFAGSGVSLLLDRQMTVLPLRGGRGVAPAEGGGSGTA
ncbi:fff4e09a-9037-4404-91b6-b00ee0c7f322 [Thermothielavioides terrestris]|uniref:Fff4e09a-9037-4404-91b6-b00ee0c7f322 n=1 Tax=Thermothielavioides terrestris TaxID=2587410 RepID=A0A3S4B0H4_9PEZI|nr:fff4e09a-9037-4404-91b6-b00ee0c7f322 [Thermothielavioides terrestris]